MFQKTFTKTFDRDLLLYVYDRLRQHDENIEIVWKNSLGISVTDEKNASAGEVRNCKGKAFFAMNPRETVVKLDNAGPLKDPLVQAMKELDIADESVDYAPGVIGLVAYALFSLGAGIFYAVTNDAWIVCAFVVGAVASTVLGVVLMALSLQNGKSHFDLPVMFILFLGMLATVPASLLVKPIVRFLRRGQLLKSVQES